MPTMFQRAVGALLEPRTPADLPGAENFRPGSVFEIGSSTLGVVRYVCVARAGDDGKRHHSWELRMTDAEKAIGRLRWWREAGAPDLSYCAGSEHFAQDVRTALEELEKYQRAIRHTVCDQRYDTNELRPFISFELAEILADASDQHTAHVASQKIPK